MKQFLMKYRGVIFTTISQTSVVGFLTAIAFVPPSDLNVYLFRYFCLTGCLALLSSRLSKGPDLGRYAHISLFTYVTVATSIAHLVAIWWGTAVLSIVTMHLLKKEASK